MTAIEWRPVVGYEGLYEVSSQGDVRSWRWKSGPRLLRPATHPDGHLQLNIGRRSLFVHQLVAAAFLGPRPVGLETRHLDGNPANNTPSNLRYGTRAENAQDMVLHGQHWNAAKTHCPQGHAYTPENSRRYRTGRVCRACERLRSRQRYAARRLAALAVQP